VRLGAAIVFNLAAAAAGTALLTLIETAGQHQRTRDLILTLAVMLVVVVVLNNQESLLLAIRSSGRWKLPRELGSSWAYQNEVGETVVVDDVLKIRHIGRLVLARGEGRIVSEGGGEARRYRIRATLDPEGILQGSWRSTSDRNYSGSFQLVGRRDGSGYAGHWTGVTAQNKVRAGIWDWHG
jgi:hypothetical protein